MTAERDHRELHAQQRRLVPLSLLADDGKASHHGVYRVRVPREGGEGSCRT